MCSKRILALVIATLLAAPAAASPVDAPKRTPELVQKGSGSFAKNCASCHGPRGEGDGVAAAALKPKPVNLATGTLKGGATPAQVFETLGKGVPGTAMIAFKHLSEEERWALAYFVADLRAQAHPGK
jgi:high-affinity iron transporter